MSFPDPTVALRLADLSAYRASETEIVLGSIARLVASGRADTRPALARATGLARSTISNGLDALLSTGIVAEAGHTPSSGRGRPATRLRIAPTAGVVLACELTSSRARLAITGLDQGALADTCLDVDLARGPERVLDAVGTGFEALLQDLGLRRGAAVVLVIALPGPVDIRRGMPVRPPIMPGWDGYPVARELERRLGCAVLVDNDVNLMALGEARALPPEQCPLLFVKIGTGIGGGLVTSSGELHHGADGAACDIGHVRVPAGTAVVCSCGNVGCVEAVASAEAIAQALREVTGDDELTQDDLEGRVRAGDGVATRLVRDAAATIGEVVATLVHFYNPARIVIGGSLADASDDILAGIRSVVYQRALPLATRNLTLTHSLLGDVAGVRGAMVAGIEHVLSPDGIARLVDG